MCSHCLLVLTQVAAVAQDLDKARAKKLVDIIGELMLSYYHFETIVQCCMGAAMRLYADCAKFAVSAEQTWMSLGSRWNREI